LTANLLKMKKTNSKSTKQKFYLIFAINYLNDQTTKSEIGQISI
jgi:hypothetical protein